MTVIRSSILSLLLTVAANAAPPRQPSADGIFRARAAGERRAAPDARPLSLPSGIEQGAEPDQVDLAVSLVSVKSTPRDTTPETQKIDALAEKIFVPPAGEKAEPSATIEQARRNLEALRAELRSLRKFDFEPPTILINLGMDPERPDAHIDYARAVLRAGAVPLLVQPSPLTTLRRYAELADGFLFTGGPDIPAQRYGQVPHPLSRPLSENKAESDWTLMNLALESGKPILGICLGMQWLNVARGGGLIQLLPTVDSHQGPPGYDIAHPVRVVEDALLASIVGVDEVLVRSSHRQAPDSERLGEGLRVAAWAEDGTIEAIEAIAEAGRFMLGVQWHPERSASTPHHRAIFDAFIRAAAKAS